MFASRSYGLDCKQKAVPSCHERIPQSPAIEHRERRCSANDPNDKCCAIDIIEGGADSVTLLVYGKNKYPHGALATQHRIGGTLIPQIPVSPGRHGRPER